MPDTFTSTYTTQRPHRSLPHQATPAAVYAARPKATPGDRTTDAHDRARRGDVDTTRCGRSAGNGLDVYAKLGRQGLPAWPLILPSYTGTSDQGYAESIAP